MDLYEPGMPFETPRIIAKWLGAFFGDQWSLMDFLGDRMHECQIDEKEREYYVTAVFVDVFYDYIWYQYGVELALPGIDLQKALFRLEGDRWRDEGPTKFSERLDRSENPVEFLQRIFGKHLNIDGVSLTDIRTQDSSLYFALLRYEKFGKVDLDELVPKPRSKRGPKPKELPIYPALLDPRDARDAALLREDANRRKERIRKQRYRTGLRMK